MQEYTGETYKIVWSRYYRKHGRNPGGFGDWKFLIGSKVFHIRGMWWKAKINAIAEAQVEGVYTIFLLP